MHGRRVTFGPLIDDITSLYMDGARLATIYVAFGACTVGIMLADVQEF